METPPERARTKPVGRAEPGQTMRDRAVRRSVLDVWHASHATGATPAARRMERITAPLLQWVVRRRVPSRVRRERCIASKQWLQSQLTSRRPLHASREQMLTDGAWFPASTARKDRHGPRRKTAHPATAEPASAAFGPDRTVAGRDLPRRSSDGVFPKPGKATGSHDDGRRSAAGTRRPRPTNACRESRQSSVGPLERRGLSSRYLLPPNRRETGPPHVRRPCRRRRVSGRHGQPRLLCLHVSARGSSLHASG